LKLIPFCFLSILSVFVQPSAAQSGAASVPDANPGRPTVSTPATLTPVGYVQFESGALFAKDSTEFSERFGTSLVTKLSVFPRLELFLQTEPLVVSRSEGLNAVHEGEVFVGAQGVLLAGAESRPTIAVSYVRRVHASVAPELDIGTFRQSASILLSDELFGFHFDANGIITEQIQGPIHRAQFGQTLSVSHPVGKFTISGEIWHFSQPLDHGNAVGNLWAVSYSLRRNLVLDGGFNHGLTETSTRWESFVGFTYLLPHRLWPERHGERP
jgi:hypothetical protein